MPDLTALASTVRGGNYAVRGGFIGTIPQTIRFSASVNMATVTYPVTAITFDTVTVGAYTDILPDSLLLVYDTTGTVLKGHLRVAYGSATSSTVVQVEEFSKGTLDLRNNDILVNLLDWRISTKLVSATEQFLPDSRIAYSGQHNNYYPVANGGGAWFGSCDSGESFATIHFDWTDSYAVDPDNTSGLTYSAAFGDGTITVGGTTTSTATVTFPAGFRFVQLSVTDADNHTVTTKYIPVGVYDFITYFPLEVTPKETNGELDSGWSMSFSLPIGSQAALDSLPDGALICYFEEEYYNGVRISYGSNDPANDRSHIKFCGYLVRDSIRLDVNNNEVTFEAVGPLAILAKTGALPQLFIRDSSPDNWQKFKGLTVAIALEDIWYWHASVGVLWDVLWPDGDEFAYSILAVTADDSLAGQLRDVATSIGVNLTCDRLGRLMLKRDPNLIPLSDRSSIVTVYDITTEDTITLDLVREHWRTTKFIRGEGITASPTEEGSLEVFSNAPGDAFGEGNAKETVSKLIVSNQDELNRVTGEYYAKRNGLYWDEPGTGAITLVPQKVKITVPDQYDWLDPANMEFVTFTLGETENERGISYSDATHWLVESVSIRYGANGTKDITWTISHETHGPKGVTYTKQSTLSNRTAGSLVNSRTTTLYNPHYTTTLNLSALPPAPADPGAINWADGPHNLLFSGDDGYLYQTANFDAASPTWTQSALVGVISSNAQFDTAFGADTLLDVAGGRVFRYENIWSATPTKTTLLNMSLWEENLGPGALAVSGSWIIAATFYSNYRDGAGNNVLGQPGNRVILHVSTDDGASWYNHILPYSGAGGWNYLYDPAIAITGAGTAYVTVGLSPGASLYSCATYGTTSGDWTDASIALGSINSNLVYDGSLYYSHYTAGTTWELYKYTGSVTDISPIVSTVPYGLTYTGLPLCVAPSNSSVLWMTSKAYVSSSYHTWKSVDAGANWTSLYSGSRYLLGIADQSAGDGTYAYLRGLNKLWYYSGGFVDKTGNLNSSFPSMHNVMKVWE